VDTAHGWQKNGQCVARVFFCPCAIDASNDTATMPTTAAGAFIVCIRQKYPSSGGHQFSHRSLASDPVIAKQQRLSYPNRLNRQRRTNPQPSMALCVLHPTGSESGTRPSSRWSRSAEPEVQNRPPTTGLYR